MIRAIRRTFHARLLPTLVAAHVLLAGCALLPGRGDPDPFTANAQDADMVTVEVSNQYESDAVVYALWSGDRHRVGFIPAGSQQSFQVRWRSSELGFHVELSNGRHFATQPILMSRQGSVHVRIPADLPSG